MADAQITKLHYWVDVIFPSILEQYKGDTLSAAKKAEFECSTRWQACLKFIVEKMQYVDDAACELPSVIDFEHNNFTGFHLDWLAGLVNVKRLAGETDAELYARFIVALDKNDAGTANSVIRESKNLSYSPSVNDVYFMNEVAATFFVYTPKGRQMLQRTVSRIAPGGVSGFPGAAIQFADGSFMGDADNDLFMAVASDSEGTGYQSKPIVTETGLYIMTEDGKRIMTEEEFV